MRRTDTCWVRRFRPAMRIPLLRRVDAVLEGTRRQRLKALIG
jgi:hypothetical protein